MSTTSGSSWALFWPTTHSTINYFGSQMWQHPIEPTKSFSFGEVAESQSCFHLLVKSTTIRDTPKWLLGETWSDRSEADISLSVQLYVLLALRQGQSKWGAAIKVGTSNEDLKYRAQCSPVDNIQKGFLLGMTKGSCSSTLLCIDQVTPFSQKEGARGRCWLSVNSSANVWHLLASCLFLPSLQRQGAEVVRFTVPLSNCIFN